MQVTETLLRQTKRSGVCLTRIYASRCAPARPRAAFTLIELLTVIVIIGILAAIIIPVVGKVRNTARTAQCKSNIRQWAVAAQLYATDNKGKLPDTGYVSKTTGTSPHYAEVELISYVANVNLPIPIVYGEIRPILAKLLCSDTKLDDAGNITGWRFGFNTFLAWEPITKFTQPSRQIFVTCSTKSWFDGTAQTHTTEYLGRIPKPHSRKVNVAYLDGSVKALFVTQIRWIDFRRDIGGYTDENRYMFNGDTQYDQ